MTIELQTFSNEEPGTWNDCIAQLEGGHLLQSWEWGEIKSRYGWRPIRLVWRQGGQPVAAAQLLLRSAARGLTLAYCPRGPLLNWGEPDLVNQVLTDLPQFAAEASAFSLKIDPAIPLGEEELEGPHMAPPAPGSQVQAALRAGGWRFSREQVQFRNTLVLDIRPSEEALLAGMKQKTRYNVRLAGRRGVTVRQGGMGDLDMLYRMYAETSLRDGFAIRDREYYRMVWGTFIEAGLAQPLIAEVEGEAVAAVIPFRFHETAYYLYGMSRGLHREKMPNHLLQWEAIRWAKQQGCTWYDFWGAPDNLDPGDRMYGVYRFKEGFGAQLIRTVGAWDYPLRPVHYAVYHRLMPALLAVMRRRGRSQTREALG